MALVDETSRERMRENLTNARKEARDEAKDFRDTIQNDLKGNTFSLGKRIVLMSVIPALIMAVACSMYGALSIKSGIQNEIYKGLKVAAFSVSELYDTVNEDEIEEDSDGNIHKGEYVISDNYDVVDTIKDNTGVDITVFYDDTRINTTIKDSSTGERVIGTKAGAAVYEKVVKNKESYESSNVEIEGMNYYGYYIPWKNTNGDTIGMIFAGKSSVEQNEYIREKCMQLVEISFVVLFATATLCIFLSRSISRGIKSAEKAMGLMAEGNLDISLNTRVLKRRDEIGAMYRALDRFSQKLKSTILSIKESSDILKDSGNLLDDMAMHTSKTTNEISKAIDDVSNGAVGQAEEVENASTHVNNIEKLVGEIVKSVEHLSETSDIMKKNSDESTVIIAQLNESNDRTNEAIQKIDRQVHATNDAVQTISKAVDVITSIAEETNLLSLNASIEAARAGEHGRGFAVVASEIQNLAEQSADSAKNIGQIIEELLKESETMVTVMGQVEMIIEQQQEKLNETREKFSSVTEGVDETSEETTTIATRTQECDSSIEKVVDVIVSLSAIAQENAASTEETTASMQELDTTVSKLADAAGELKKLSEALSREVQFFKL